MPPTFTEVGNYNPAWICWFCGETAETLEVTTPSDFLHEAALCLKCLMNLLRANHRSGPPPARSPGKSRGKVARTATPACSPDGSAPEAIPVACIAESAPAFGVSEGRSHSHSYHGNRDRGETAGQTESATGTPS